MANIRIKELREKCDLTQKQLAKDMHVSSQTILNWENSLNFPDYDKLIEMADYFGVTLDYLLYRDDEPHALVITANCLRRIEKDDLIRAVMDLLRAAK